MQSAQIYLILQLLFFRELWNATSHNGSSTTYVSLVERIEVAFGCSVGFSPCLIVLANVSLTPLNLINAELLSYKYITCIFLFAPHFCQTPHPSSCFAFSPPRCVILPHYPFAGSRRVSALDSQMVFCQ